MQTRAATALAITLLAVLSTATTASADTVAIQVVGGSLPWTDPNHQSPLELFAGQIASHVANRSVTVRCEGDTDWQALAIQNGFDPGVEAGFVLANWTTLNGIPVGAPKISGFTELGPSVCLSLQNFAVAPSKPTKCSQPLTQTSTRDVPTQVSEKRKVRVRVKVGNKSVWRTVTKKVTVTKQVPTQVQTQVPGPLAPCFANAASLPVSDSAFWPDYDAYAFAILALAHESIHLGGFVGGRLSSGIMVGDPQAEAHANCYGMQWVPWIATQLGDTPDDALAIAQYVWDVLYPRYQGTPYWSADCVPGGPMDIRADKSGTWP